MVRKSRRSRNKRHRHGGGEADAEENEEKLSWDDFKTDIEQLKEDELMSSEKKELKKLRDSAENATTKKEAAAKGALDNYIKKLQGYQRGKRGLELEDKHKETIKELKQKYENLINNNNKRWKGEGCQRDIAEEEERRKDSRYRGYVVKCEPAKLFNTLQAEETADINAFISFAHNILQNEPLYIWNEFSPSEFTPPSWLDSNGEITKKNLWQEKTDKMHGNNNTTPIPLGGLWEGPTETGGARRIDNFFAKKGASEQSGWDASTKSIDTRKAALDRLMRSTAEYRKHQGADTALSNNIGGRRRTKRRRKSRGGKRRTKRRRKSRKSRKSRGGKRRKRRTKRRRR
jgi:hypothetical protein